MIHKSALYVSGAIAKRGIINEEDAEVYAYGFELMISTAINIVIVILISLLFRVPLAWVFFLLPFIPLRLTAGGYHANTHLACGLVFCVAYTILLLPAVYLTAFMTPLLLSLVSGASLLLVLLFSPVPASTKPLDDAKRSKNRRKSIVLSVLLLLATALSFVTGPNLRWMFTYFALGQAGAAISLLAAKLAHRK
jgi:accessory gene regulator B